jgi:predicted nucleic acid-binding protein
MLLDTCIVIDVLRGKTAALDFLTALPQPPAICAVTATELVAGCKNAGERRHIDRLLSHLVVHDVGLAIASLAGEYIRRYGPSHGTDPIDALIAATARTQSIPLATLNLKHFPMFAGLSRPYRA